MINNSRTKPISTKMLIYDAMKASIKVRKRVGRDFYFLDKNINFLKDDGFSTDQLINLFRQEGYNAWFAIKYTKPNTAVTGIIVYWGDNPEKFYQKHLNNTHESSYSYWD